MRECSLSKKAVLIFTLFYSFLVLFLLSITPFSYSEANILFSIEFNIDSYIVKSIYNYSSSVIALRLPFFILAIAIIYLYLELLKDYFKEFDSYYNLGILFFLLTPGIFLSFILVNYATLPIFLTLLFLYSYKKDIKLLEVLSLVLLLFTHTAQFVLYIAVALYAYRDKRFWLVLLAMSLFILVSVEAKYGVDGVPRGHLVQLIGIYAAIFSPLLFIAIIYSLYKVAINKDRDLVWYITLAAFVVSVMLSIRQKIKVTDFAPYLTVVVPLVIVSFRSSIVVRLPRFRKNYYKICKIVLIVLLLETLVIAFHYPLYKLYPRSSLLLDSRIYEVKDIASSLNSTNNKCKDVIGGREKNLYLYYGIKKCD